MKKKIVSFIASCTIAASVMPCALADHSDYVGSYYTLNSDAPGYAALDIHTCDSNSITLDFARIKNDAQPYTYTFDPGIVSGDNAIIPFHATITASGAVFSGKMELTFQGNGDMVKIKLTSNLGSEMFSGTLPKVSSSRIQPSATAAPTEAPAEVPAEAVPTPVPTPNVRVNLNGADLEFDSSVHPQIIDNYTYVPLRSVFYNMGINVYWDEYQKTDILREQLITCTKDNTIVQFSRTLNNYGENVWVLKKWVNSDTSSDDYTNIDIIDQQPKIINNRSYIPLRVISEALGAYVDWVDLTRTVVISCDTSNAYWYDRETIALMEDFSPVDAQNSIPGDYSEIVPFSTPYFAPQSKFYLFNAADMYNNVKLKVYYGGYLDVTPDIDTAYTDQPTEAPAEVITDVPTEAPAEPTTTPVVYTFDLSEDEPTPSPAPETTAE